MSRIRQYFRSAGALVGQTAAQRVLGMITTMVLARTLSSSGLGIYSAVVNTASSAYGMVRLGVDASILVHTAETHHKEAARQATGEMLGAGLVLLLISGIVGGMACVWLDEWLATQLYGQPELRPWLSMAGVLVFVQCLSQFCYAMLAGQERFISYSRVMILSAVLGTVAISAGCLAWGLAGALAAMALTQLVTFLWLWHTARLALNAESISLSFRCFGNWTARHTKLGFPSYAAGLLAVPAIYYIQGVLSRNAGLEALAELRIVVSVLAIISFAPTAASGAMVSMMSRSSAENYQIFVRDLWLNLKFVWLFAMLAGLVAFLLMPFLVGILFGAAYEGAIFPASIAILTTIVSCVISVPVNALFSRKRAKVIFLQTLVQMVFFVASAVVLIPKFGLSGYVAADLIGSLAAATLLWTVSSDWRRRQAVTPGWLVPAALLTIFDGVFLIVLSSLPIEARLVGASALILVTLGVSYLFVIEEREREILREKWPALMRLLSDVDK